MVTSNECKFNRESIFVPTQLLNTVQEQSVELDYVLPDYYPDFFRLLHCTAEPTVLQWECKEGMLHYVCAVCIRIWYCAEHTETVQTVTQRLEYTKQIPLPPDQDPAALRIRLQPEPSYLNCRAINSRRIDVRGAVRIHAQISGELKQQVLCDVSGLHTQCRKEPVTYLSKIVRAAKRFSLAEEISIAETQPPVLSVLRDTAQLSIHETRCVAGKLVIKGEAAVSLLYAAQGGMETLHFTIPFSQIAEPEGLEEGMTCIAEAELIDHTITAESDSNGDIRLLRCELQIRLLCEAMRASLTELVTDLYSTVHPCHVETDEIALLSLPVPVQETLSCKAQLRRPDSVIAKVYAAWAEPGCLSFIADDEHQQMLLCGDLRYYVMASDAEGKPMLLTETESVHQPLSMAYQCGQTAMGTPEIRVRHCNYTLPSSDTVSLQTELCLSGQCMRQTIYAFVTDAQVHGEERLPQNDRYALRLYFGQEQESLWEIAKRFHTAVSAIMEENDCEGSELTQPQMLLIPIVL